MSKHFQFSVDRRGSVFFGGGEADIYFAEWREGAYLAPVRLPAHINTTAPEMSPQVSPDGGMLLFDRFFESRPYVRIMASFRGAAGEWTEPVDLSPYTRSEGNDSGARLSPDGRYLFFQSAREGSEPNRSVYWMEAAFLERLRGEALGTAGAAPPPRPASVSGVRSQDKEADVPGIPTFERDPQLTRLETDVVAAGEEKGRPFVVLADTLFYPEGGGQPADRGTVGGIAVVDVRKTDGDIRHVLAGPAPSGRVTLGLDWPRRFDHMQQHTGQHLLTAVAQQRFGWSTTAFHLGERISDIELATPGIRPEQLTDLEEAVAAEVRAARPVTSRRVSAEEYAQLPVRTRGLPDGHAGSVRLVEIAGLDLNTCGGTHLRSTAEIEALKLLDTESLRGGTRLFYAAGTRLRRLLGTHGERNEQLRKLLCTSDDELVAGLATKLEQLKDAQRISRDLEEELATASAHVLAAASERVLSAHWPRRDLPFLQRVAREVGQLAPDRVVLLTAGEGEKGAFLLGAGERAAIDVTAAGRKVAEILGGRGGGSGHVFQGKAKDLARREEAVRLIERSL